MKRILLSLLSLTAMHSVSNAQCTELFISEYVEGSGNNKAIELYNPTAADINFNSNYRLIRWSNGDASADQNAQLVINLGNNVVPSYGTFVIVLDKRDPAGTGQEVQADPALQAVADTFLSPNYGVNNVMYFNGNDAMSLQKFNGSTWSNIDIFGKIGEDPGPGTAWTDVFPYSSNAGKWITRDHTMVRKANIQQGVAVNPGAFNPMAEYDTLPENTFTMLGNHVCDRNATSVIENNSFGGINIFPNPASEEITINAETAFNSIVISDICGREVYNTLVSSSKTSRINLSSFEKGIYLITLRNEEGRKATTRIIRK